MKKHVIKTPCSVVLNIYSLTNIWFPEYDLEISTQPWDCLEGKKVFNLKYFSVDGIWYPPPFLPTMVSGVPPPHHTGYPIKNGSIQNFLHLSFQFLILQIQSIIFSFPSKPCLDLQNLLTIWDTLAILIYLSIYLKAIIDIQINKHIYHKTNLFLQFEELQFTPRLVKHHKPTPSSNMILIHFTTDANCVNIRN